VVVIEDGGKQKIISKDKPFLLDYKKNADKEVKIKVLIDDGIFAPQEVLVDVLEQKFRGEKIIIQKKNRRKGYERKKGFTPVYTMVRFKGVGNGK